MIKRAIAKKLKSLSGKFPVVAVVGPRQSGKTTLVKYVFPAYTYVSLEDIDMREFAMRDPRGFLATHSGRVIIDEVQRVPSLFSYIQTAVDNTNTAGQFILTGSHNILLQQNISQTLAGRIAIVKLLPFSLAELKNAGLKLINSEEYIFKGFYPRLYDKNIPPSDWYPGYIQTYVERDVRLIKNITNLTTFQKFIRLCAGRTGQILNLSALGNDCGITHNTARDWLSILETGYVIFLLKPFYKNFNKRLIKMPKLYFYDTGLVCSLLGIRNKKQIITHYLKGNLFENLVIAEIIKCRYGEFAQPDCYYWRDKTGNEIDCIIETSKGELQIEIKSGATITKDFFNGLSYWKKLKGQKNNNPYLIFSGNENQKRADAKIISWKNIKSGLAL